VKKKIVKCGKKSKKKGRGGSIWEKKTAPCPNGGGKFFKKRAKDGLVQKKIEGCISRTPASV